MDGFRGACAFLRGQQCVDLILRVEDLPILPRSYLGAPYAFVKAPFMLDASFLLAASAGPSSGFLGVQQRTPSYE